MLNERQIAYAQAVAVGGMSANEAAKRAGYKDSTRHTPGRLIQTPLVQQEIDRLRELTRANMRIDAETWNRQLVYQYQKYMDTDGALALRALEAWARSLGLFDTKAESGSVELANRLLALLAQASRPQLPEVIEGAYRVEPIEPNRD